MSELVFSLRIPALLEKLSSGEWLLPEFQREFVWDTAAITALVSSVIDGKPIGMATVWELVDDPGLELHHLWLYDRDFEKRQRTRVYFGDDEARANRCYAILDGRQRCTALAIAFGGFQPKYHQFKLAGRLFIDVTTEEDDKRVVYIRDTELRKRNLLSDANCIAEGLFPLVSYDETQDIEGQWLDYMFHVKDKAFYPEGKLPDDQELARRSNVLKAAHRGIFATELAVYRVPKEYDLGEICEIFETLNTTGTVVSTVDLIHSWLYAETSRSGEPLQLREWIKRLGDIEGAVGWALPEKRPELIAQLATACHVAAEKKYEPRKLKGRKPAKILSVKSPDLLATPTSHWLQIIEKERLVAEFLGDFQRCVAGGFFPFEQCPYPISAFIYVGLRWHKSIDDSSLTANWTVEDLNALYRAFFWRNALSGRYDQGFLTKIGKDIERLKGFLNRIPEFSNRTLWADRIGKELQQYMEADLESQEALELRLKTVTATGAFRSAVMLSMVPLYMRDFVSQENVAFPDGEKIQLHHIFPRKWTKKNLTADIRERLDPEGVGLEWEDSPANLMPLSRGTNTEWSDFSPAKFLENKAISFESVRGLLEPAAIDEECFEILLNSTPDLRAFWDRRAYLLASRLLAATQIKF